MRKWSLLLSILCLLTLSVRTTALPPLDFDVIYSAYIEVFDTNNNPVSGVNVCLRVDAWEGETGMPILRIAEGTTNANGYVALYCYINYYDYPQLTSMVAFIDEPGRIQFIAQGNHTTTNTTIYPDLWCMTSQEDTQDLDGIPDALELQIAEKYKPVLHKHSYDYQQGLANFDDILVNHARLKANRIDHNGEELYNQNMPPIHAYSTAGYCSFGTGQIPTAWHINIDDDARYSGATTGNRPIYYHVFKQGGYYYVQYWYFFTMNDVSDMTQQGTWHEGDWEHVSIRLQRTGLLSTPTDVNFYRHTGGRTVTASQCWWSSSNSLNYNCYQGYSESRTHLHIWLAANAHASYNRYQEVYRIQVDFGCSETEDYRDNVDYDPSGYNLYFPYDVLVKMGEAVSETYCVRHGYTWFNHTDPIAYSKEWLAYIGRIGEYWILNVGVTTVATRSPNSPYQLAGSSHQYLAFTLNYSTAGFGNNDNSYFFGLVQENISWVTDSSSGD